MGSAKTSEMPPQETRFCHGKICIFGIGENESALAVLEATCGVGKTFNFRKLPESRTGRAMARCNWHAPARQNRKGPVKTA
jgi:hypothetical protein